jgi:hypothetical protein
MSITPEHRKKFEKQGYDLTRQCLQMGIVDRQENIAAQAWLTEQERKRRRSETWRFWWMLIFTIVAAVGASIAAWPIVKDWVTK